jgi:integrase
VRKLVRGSTAPRRGQPGARIAERLAVVPAPELRRVMIRYVEVRAATLRPATVTWLTDALILVGEFLGIHHPEVASLRQLERHHVEAFLAWNRTRPWRGRVARPKPVAASVVHATVLAVRNFFDDLALWGWAERPARQLVFPGDVPRLPRPLPRALAPDVDAALMTAVATLQDRFARCGLLVLRGAGLRLGELLDLELDSVIDYGPPGSWLRVPLGKLGTQRSVPLDATTLPALDDWAAHRGPAAGAAAPPRRPPHRPPVGVSLDERWTAGEQMASDRGASSCHPAGDGIGVRIWMPTSRSIRKKMNARRHPRFELGS